LRQLPSTIRSFGLGYDLGSAPTAEDVVADPPGILQARRIKEAAALSVHAPEISWEDGELVLCRAVPDGEPLPVLAAVPLTAPPSREAIARLQHAYKLRDQLDPAWAARPLRLVTERGRLTLLSKDPGGEPLLRLLGQPWEIASFLRLAIGLAAALARLHERGLIHKDIKPANVLVNNATSAVWLTGFGIASHLPRERQAPGSTEAIVGTLAYMAPEQTGRMHRSIDSRSDLYACGVTLYETITGSLPFSASDPLEWIHCHIARPPTPPSERVYGIPGPIGHHLEAAREVTRGPVSDRGGPRGRSARVPDSVGDAPEN
jgi:Protein kinase domain